VFGLVWGDTKQNRRNDARMKELQDTIVFLDTYIDELWEDRKGHTDYVLTDQGYKAVKEGW